MTFTEFKSKIFSINEELFKNYNHKSGTVNDNLGAPTISNAMGELQSVLMLNINPNPKGTGEEERPEGLHPLIYIPEEYDEKIRDYFDDLHLTWNTSGKTKPYKRAYELVANDVKMFWAVKGEYEFEEEIENYISEEYKPIWKECFEKESEKDKEYQLVFADLFYYCEGKQKDIENHLNKQKFRDEKVKEIIDLYIEYYNPKFIIVTNALASKLIYNSVIGSNEAKPLQTCYKNVGIFFTQMLFGQNALVNVGYNELKQQIHNNLH